MSTSPPTSSRQRPNGSAGPARDAALDARIIAAALALLSEEGYEAVTMEKVAARAGVGKATVYRRWASLADLVADALETVGFARPAATEVARGPVSLREDLIRTLIEVTGCLDPDRHQLVVAGLEAARRHPWLAGSLRARFTRAVEQSISAALDRAQAHRGESLPSTQVDDMTTATVVALLTHLPALKDRPLQAADFESITDRVLLPLLQRP